MRGRSLKAYWTYLLIYLLGKNSQKAHVQLVQLSLSNCSWTCTRLQALRERIALTFKTCACAQGMSWRIFRPKISRYACAQPCVQRCFSKRCIFRPVAARAERKVPHYSVLSVLKRCLVKPRPNPTPFLRPLIPNLNC